MLKSFLAFLGGEPGEEKPMLLLLGMGFFMGIFLATYQVGAETLFLLEMDESYLDQAFFAAGAAGIFTTYLFVILQKRINYSTLIVSIFFLIVLFMVGMRGAFSFTQFESGKEELKYLPFTMFVMIGPITAITLVGFWGLFGRMFDLRASKRIIGGIDTGALTATILAFFSIPFIQEIPGMDHPYDLLLVSAIASFGVLIFTLWIIKDFNVDKATKSGDNDKNKPKEVNFFGLFKNPYLRLLCFFLIFSVGASIFVDYTFYSVTDINFPDEDQLTTFLSFFSGTVMIMSFLIQSFVNDIIIDRFGLKVALMTMPIILILFTIGGIFSGHLYGYETRTKEFLYFFLFTVSAKAFTASLRDALESPAFKLFFLPIDIRIRFDIQSRIEGVINQLAILVAGAAQMGLGLLTYFELIHYSYFIVGIAVGVIFAAIKLFDQYKVTLKETLEEQKKALKGEGARNEDTPMNVIKEELSSKEPSRIINALKVLERIDPIQLERSLLDSLNVRFPEVRRYAYKKLDELVCFDALEIIKKDAKSEGDEEALALAKTAIKNLEKAEAYEMNDVSLRKLIRSTESEDRVYGARILSKSTDDKHLPYVLELLRDINPKVRKAAIISAGKLRRPELWPVLVEHLHHSTYSNVAMSAIALGGEAAFHTIDTSFYKTGQYPSTMFRIIQLLGKIGGRSAQDLLWKKIDFPDKQIVSELLLALSYQGFQSRDFQSARIKLIFESEIGDITWNMKTATEIQEENHVDEMISAAFKEEDRRNYNNLFMLLSMIYDSQNIRLVKENIQDGTSESITFGVEMMNIFVEEELKPKLFPVVDEIKLEDKLNKLHNFYPPEDFESYYDLLLQVINRDYNRINRYTKALALYRISQMEGVEVSNDLIANLFNPDPLLLQTAAYTMYKLDTDAYHLNTKRLKPSVKKELDKAILPPVFRGEDEDFHQKLLLIERVLFVKEVYELQHIPGDMIADLTELLDEVRIQEGTTIVEEGDHGQLPIYMILEGEVDIYKGDQMMETRGKGSLVGEQVILDDDVYDFTALTRNRCTFLILSKEDLFDFMSKHIEAMEVFVNIFNGYVEKEVELSDALFSV
ncbi:HEAT repeat domain-containing protein [Marinoscillum sp. MHG1-6]|uniref:HEAT repeat domain-containing protein n=1 Tax=Marinoscillum sp. MHG1-6 TaxID=2959627 RepID=UPI00215839B7|nr:HEAT repeat domain-containing protein [Marinoscillum sp. MHG1-6]